MAGPNPLRELTLARIRSFLREPEALFWTFGFPIIMAVGLGLAFRERPAERAAVGIERGSVAERYAPALRASPEVDLKILAADSAETAVRRGDVAVLLTGRDALTYRYDPARPESRSAQLVADGVVQRAAGASDRVPSVHDRERRPGGRYIDWVLPGLIGMNLMSTGLWGMGFGIVQMRQKKQILPGFRSALAFTSTRTDRHGYRGAWPVQHSAWVPHPDRVRDTRLSRILSRTKSLMRATCR
ncbi:MAG TPA: hypothetical protein VEQ60_14950 [Longimicrobium sp.]|nr:hypothetical protein [Longimicrobium sp.]